MQISHESIRTKRELNPRHVAPETTALSAELLVHVDMYFTIKRKVWQGKNLVKFPQTGKEKKILLLDIRTVKLYNNK